MNEPFTYSEEAATMGLSVYDWREVSKEEKCYRRIIKVKACVF